MAEPLDLEPIKAREKKATPGPWTRPTDSWRDELIDAPKIGPDADPEFPVWPIVRACSSPEAYKAWDGGNAAFVASARTDVPALVAEVERLREALKKIALQRCQYPHVPCPVFDGRCDPCLASEALGQERKT